MISILALVVPILSTFSPIKVHVEGEGYMRFIRGGRVVYAKQATLTNVGGDLGANGAKLLPEIALSDSVSTLTVDLMGNVDSGPSHMGRIVLGTFPKGSTSAPEGDFLAFSDQATLTNPGEGAAGVIRVDCGLAIADPKPSVQSQKLPRARKQTDDAINLAIVGAGYFSVSGPNGSVCYTRNGVLLVSQHGELETQNGFLLEPNITIPTGSTKISVSSTGRVSAILPGESESKILGSIILTKVTSPSDLTKLDDDLFAINQSAGTPLVATPGQSGLGLIKFNGSLHGDDSEIAAAPSSAPKTTAAKVEAHRKKVIPTKSTNGAQIEIIVRQHTDVTSKNFTIGDIADVTGPEELVTAYKKIAIGATAIAGANRRIDQHYLVLKLMGAGFQPGSYALIIPDGADVARKTVTISADDIVAAAVKAAQDKAGMKVQFKTLDAIVPVVAEDGAVSVEASDATLANKNYRVIVTVRQGTLIIATRTVTLSPPSDLGSIKIGDAVSIILKAGGVEIEVPGKAISAGFVGQKIQVSITGTGGKATTQTGTLVDAGKVEVDL